MNETQWVFQMLKWGVKFKVYPGFGTRGRPGDFAPRGFMQHHTGSDGGQSDDYLNFLFVRGRPEEGIPGPLCNIATDMDGDVHLGAAGRANHAGSGSSTTLAKVTSENYDAYTEEIKPGPDDLNGNGYYYGNEWRYDGGQPPTAAMWNSAVLVAAAVCDFHGWTAASCLAHREHTRRKNDPGNVLMYKFRSAVDARLKAGPTITEDVLMAISDADAQKIANFVWAKMMGPAGAQSTAEDAQVKARIGAEALGAGGRIGLQLDRIEADTDRIP
jgi:hypothetical protein